MLDDMLDPVPRPQLFANAIAARAAERNPGAAELHNLLRCWHDREGPWTNLRNLAHWIERTQA